MHELLVNWFYFFLGDFPSPLGLLPWHVSIWKLVSMDSVGSDFKLIFHNVDIIKIR